MFLKLTRILGNASEQTVLVNMDHVIFVNPQGQKGEHGATLATTFTADKYINVKETRDEILKRLG